MAVKFLDKTGLGYFWGKIKAWCNSTFAVIAHTHTSYAVKHSYTTAANQAKAWLRIANANTHQMDISKPLHVQFLLTAWNPDQPADYYAQWFVDCQIFGRNSGIRIFGTSGAPFSQARVLYENTNADIDTSDRPAIDIYLNYVLATACHVEIQEVYNSGWVFLADGVLAASTVPTGFENRAVGVYGSGIANSGYCDYAARTRLQRSNITSNITLANNDTYRSRVLNCTNAITITVPSLDNDYAWFLIKNFNATNTTNNVTIHPSTTSVKIDDSNADIVLKPGEWVIIASKAANSYSLIGDGRWKSQKADKATTLAGYGITDAKIANGTITLGSNSITPLTSHQTLPTLSRTISGSGNAITDITVSNHAITATKGTTFLTSHQSLADYAKLASPAFTGTPTAPTAAASTNNTQIATTAFVKSQGYLTSHQTLPTLSKTDSGSGNAVTAISVSNHAITVTKGSTFLTASSTLDATKLSGTIPSGCYTNTTYTAGTGLSLSGTKFSLASHNQASNTINAMTGYSKPNSTSAIATSDTLNQAIGKLEKAIDDADISNTVHLTGNEFIGGIKEFGNSYYDSTIEGETDWESSSVIIRYQNYIKGSGTPSANKYANILFLDKTGTNINWNGRLGLVESCLNSEGANIMRLSTVKNEVINGVSTRDSATMGVGYDSDGVKFAYAPSTSSDRSNSTDIVTRGWLADDTRLVHTTGEETIAGTKLLTSDPYIKKGDPTLHTINTDLTRNTAPSSDIGYFLLLALDANGSPGTAGNRFGGIYHSYGTTKANTMHLIVYNGKTRDVEHESIAIGYLSNGSVYTYAPHPADSDNSHNITTSYWVRRYCDTTQKYYKSISTTGSGNAVTAISASNGALTVTKGTTFLTSHQSLDSCVKTSGNQTIGGTKSFTSYIQQMNSSIVKNTNPSSDSFCHYRAVDKNGTQFGGIQFSWRTDSNKKNCDAKLWIDPCLTNGDGAAVIVKRRTDTYSFEPNSNGVMYLGIGAARWNTIYSSSSSISTSDKRLKDNIIGVPSDILDIWDNVDWIQYQMIDAIKLKGSDKARIHNGLIAQQIDTLFKNKGLDASRYGLFCYDEWEAENPDYDENGNITNKGREAGNCYSIRYEEALAMEAAYQRRKNKILENRISELEKQVSDMLQILQNLTSNNG